MTETLPDLIRLEDAGDSGVPDLRPTFWRRHSRGSDDLATAARFLSWAAPDA
jgi:hypothetical protein